MQKQVVSTSEFTAPTIKWAKFTAQISGGFEIEFDYLKPSCSMDASWLQHTVGDAFELGLIRYLNSSPPLY